MLIEHMFTDPCLQGLLNVNKHLFKFTENFCAILSNSTHALKVSLTTPASGFLLRPLLKVDARVEEQLSSYRAVRPSLMAELMEIVHMLEA